ncbi:hypothetical protein [Streptomyces katrae]|nr:hypothetical protein [Streptomyces katrae]
MCTCGALPDHDECSTCAVPPAFADSAAEDEPHKPTPPHTSAYPDEPAF